MKKNKIIAEINIVPYVDLMLVLLVIFMANTLQNQQSINIDIPQTKADHTLMPEKLPVIVYIDKNNKMFLEDEMKSLEQEQSAKDILIYLTALNQENGEQKVFLKADKGIPYARIMEAISIIEASGAKSIGLITEKTQNE